MNKIERAVADMAELEPGEYYAPMNPVSCEIGLVNCNEDLMRLARQNSSWFAIGFLPSPFGDSDAALGKSANLPVMEILRRVEDHVARIVE